LSICLVVAACSTDHQRIAEAQVKTYVGGFLVALVVSMLVMPLVKRLAVRYGAIDTPGERKIHRVPTARMGGLAIVAGIGAAMAFVVVLDNRIAVKMTDLGWRLGGPLLATGLIVALGIYDDLKGASAAVKLPVQIMAALIVWYSGVQVHHISNPFGESLDLGIFALPFVVLWIVTLTNAINLIDGIDGLAAGVVVIASGALLVKALHNGNVPMAFMCACVAGGCAGFLRFNFPPAHVFMGDTGSLALGFIFGWMSILASHKGAAAAALLVPALALGLPLADIAAAVVRRVTTGASIFKADHDHIHHAVLRRSESPRVATLSLYAVSLALALAAIGFTYMKTPWAAVALLVLCAALLVSLGGRTINGAASRSLDMDAGLRQIGARAIEQVDVAGSLENVGEALRTLAGGLGCLRARLAVFDGEESLFECNCGGQDSEAESSWPQTIRWTSDEERFRALLTFDLSHLPPDQAGRASLLLGTCLSHVGDVLPRLIDADEPRR